MHSHVTRPKMLRLNHIALCDLSDARPKILANLAVLGQITSAHQAYADVNDGLCEDGGVCGCYALE